MPFFLPCGQKNILLHCCCAPCSCALIDFLLREKVVPTLFFYNPNIHPQEEYERRKKELMRYALKRGVTCVDGDYEVESWFQRVQGHEKDPEKGERCSMCFEMRFLKTAEYASQHGFKIISSSLGFSRWKNFDQVTRAGKRAAQTVEDIIYFEYNWRKGGMVPRSQEIALEEQFYRQSYCGCLFSQEKK